GNKLSRSDVFDFVVFSRLCGVVATRGSGCALCPRSSPTSRNKCAWSDPPTQQERFHFVFLIFQLFFLQFFFLRKTHPSTVDRITPGTNRKNTLNIHITRATKQATRTSAYFSWVPCITPPSSARREKTRALFPPTPQPVVRLAPASPKQSTNKRRSQL
ncbi:unnamed protein product, partial [Ectocarpus sp. 12 AP-2014]